MFEFTEYSPFQLLLDPEGDQVEIVVTERGKDEIDRIYRSDLDQVVEAILDVTNQYCNWIIDQQPELDSNEPIQELQKLSEEVSDMMSDSES